jgi:hypothetical protein
VLVSNQAPSVVHLAGDLAFGSARDPEATG